MAPIDKPLPNGHILWWLLGTLFLVWCMVMLGGATRLTHAGLSIVEWRPITGIIPPLTDGAWGKAFADYQNYPEYKLVHYNMSLSEFKFIFFMEYFHRLLGRLMGIFFIIPLVIFWRRGWLTPVLKRRSFWILGLGLAQGAMGWYMVKSGLVKDPAVSHYRLTAHLGIAFLIAGVLLWTLFDCLSVPKAKQLNARLYIGFTLILQLITMLYGGFVAGLKAGLIYNTFPLMEGDWLPGEWNFLHPLWVNFFENAAMVQWIHRVLGTLSFLFVWLVVIKSTPLEKQIKRCCLWWAAATTIQLGLGILTLLYHVPATLGTIHQGWAMVILALGLLCLYTQRKEFIK